MVVCSNHDNLHKVCFSIHFAKHLLGHLADSVRVGCLWTCWLEPMSSILGVSSAPLCSLKGGYYPLHLHQRLESDFSMIVLPNSGQLDEIHSRVLPFLKRFWFVLCPTNLMSYIFVLSSKYVLIGSWGSRVPETSRPSAEQVLRKVLPCQSRYTGYKCFHVLTPQMADCKVFINSFWLISAFTP